MPSKSSGKTVTKININKKTVSIFFNKERISVTHDAYVSEGPFYVGQELTNKDIKRIKEFSNSAKLYNYALGLLKRYRYSEWKLREKLYLKEAPKEEVNLVVDKLKKIGLLNDLDMVNEFIDISNNKNIGKNKIISDLLNRGIFEETISKIKFPYSIEKQKASNQLPRLEKRYAKLAYNSKKQHIYASMTALGFDSEIINEVMLKVAPRVEKDELGKLRLDYLKTKKRLSYKYEGKTLYEKIINSLLTKGYRYTEIKKVMEVNDYENDF